MIINFLRIIKGFPLSVSDIMSSNLHLGNGNLYQGDHLLMPDADFDTANVMINVCNLETKRADFFYEEATALHCKHEHLLTNHRELQRDHKLLEREKDDLQQDKVTLTNHILSLEVRESHIRSELEGYKDLLNQVLNASPQPEVIPTNLNAIITPQRQPRGTNTNTLQEHHNCLVALNIPFHDASSRHDFNLRIQNESGYVELPSNDYYHFNAHLNIFPTYNRPGVNRSVPTKHDFVKRQYDLIVDTYRGFRRSHFIDPWAARGDSSLFTADTVGKVKAFLRHNTMVWEAIPSKYEISQDSDLIRFHTKKLACSYFCPEGSFELLMMIAHDNQNTLHFTRTGNTIHFPAYREFIAHACVSQYKSKKSILERYAV